MPSAPDNSQTFLVRGFRISGNTVFGEAELIAQLDDAEGKPLGLGDLQRLTDRITRHYRNAGYPVARAYLPAQEIRDGIVRIAVLEGRIESVTVNNSAGIGASALAPVERIAAGEVVRTDSIEDGLLRLADIPGVEIRSTLRPGQALGTSEFLVDVAPGRRLTGEIDADNYGNRYTGANRLGGALYWNNPGGLGDQLTLRAQASDAHFNYARIGYHLPAGSAGTRIGAAWSSMHYRLSREFDALDADGEATIGSLYLQHPLLRSRQASWYANLQFDNKHLDDRIGATDTRTEKRLRNWSIGINGHFLDMLGGGGRNSAALTLTRGRLDLDDTTATIDAVSARSRGSFGKLVASYQRLQRLPGDFTLSLALTGQWADKNLDASEKFMLGGAQGVRAYPQGDGSGDEGHLLNLELRYALQPGWEAMIFHDDGRVKINETQWTATKNSRHLAGSGLGTSYTRDQFSLGLHVAWRTSDAAPASDKDRHPRLWLQGVYRF